MSGRKNDAGKLRYDLVDSRAHRDMVRVLTYGAEKYEPENWRRVPNAFERYYAAAMRHLEAWRQGESVDQETGISHLAHAACCVHFLQALPKSATEHENELNVGAAEPRPFRVGDRVVVQGLNLRCGDLGEVTEVDYYEDLEACDLEPAVRVRLGSDSVWYGASDLRHADPAPAAEPEPAPPSAGTESEREGGG